MNRELLIRAVCLYWPLLAAAVAWGVIRPGYFARVGLLIALCWNLAVLPLRECVGAARRLVELRVRRAGGAGDAAGVVSGLGGVVGAWRCRWSAGRLLGIRPVVFVTVVMAVAAALDAVAMPRMEPVLVLHEGWWTGRRWCSWRRLVPGLLALWWTDRRTCLGGRVLVQGGAFGLLLLGVIPCVADGGWEWVRDGLAPSVVGVGTPGRTGGGLGAAGNRGGAGVRGGRARDAAAV